VVAPLRHSHSLSRSFLHSFAVRGNSSPCFSITSALFAKTQGCTPVRNPSSPCKSALSPRPETISMPPGHITSFPLHPPSHGGTISFVIRSLRRETFPLVPVSNSRERTTGSTARLIQQSARDRRPGPLAIRGRHPDLFAEKGRPGKASSVRLGERSIVGS